MTRGARHLGFIAVQTRYCWWRTHSCVPRRHSWRRLRILGSQRQRHECRCGTHECVRHFSPLHLGPFAGMFVESADAERKSKTALPRCVFEGACGTSDPTCFKQLPTGIAV